MNIKIEDFEESLSMENLKRAEETIVATLPEEYKQFLMKYNGGRAFNIKQFGGGLDFEAITDGDDNNFFGTYNSLKGRIPEDTVAIAIDPGGNYVLLGIKGPNRGKVFFWMLDFEDREEWEAPYESKVDFVANSFNEFLDSLSEYNEDDVGDEE
ncbi:MAG: SMI1/KNR4 family protein [Candidatus Desantisbacteria bacterium]